MQTIILKKFGSGEAGSTLLTSHVIIFVLDGAAKYAIPVPENITVTVHPNEFIFVPASTSVTWEMPKDSTVLMFKLNDMIGSVQECRTFRFQRQSGNPQADPAVEHKGIYPLTMNERIRTFVEDVVTTQNDGLRCVNYARHLIAILMTRIQVYYPQEEYVRFFTTTINPDVAFSEQVYEKWMGCRKIGELADAMNMTITQFNQRFRRVFGETPGEWLHRRRREYIHSDICSSHIPIGEIAVKHGFSLSNLVRYCRTNFGNTPGSMRRSLTNNDPGYISDDAIKNPTNAHKTDKADRQTGAWRRVSSAEPGNPVSGSETAAARFDRTNGGTSPVSTDQTAAPVSASAQTEMRVLETATVP